ncbi:MAG: hypothetical protein WDM92_05665, partial [Caulobacteraceae bacterium]
MIGVGISGAGGSPPDWRLPPKWLAWSGHSAALNDGLRHSAPGACSTGCSEVRPSRRKEKGA